MHMPSIWGLLIVLVLAFLLFGKPGRLSSMMEDVGKGIKGFRKGLSDGDKGDGANAKTDDPPKRITDQTGSTTTSSSEQTNKSGT
jgi:sec-independent protein translocase protein TatA